MDKGLKVLQNLQKELEDLQKQKSQNDKELSELRASDNSLEFKIENLEQKILELKNEKLTRELAPQRRKDDKKSFTIVLAVATLIAIATILVVTVIGGAGITQILRSLIWSVMGGLILDPIILVNEFFKINMMHPIGNLKKFEKKIEESNEQLESIKKQKKKICDKIVGLEEINNILENQINELASKIGSITSLRTKVIDEFYKNYSSLLDEKLNNVYEQEFEKKIK